MIPWNELENHYSAKFFKRFRVPAKPLRKALGVRIIKEKLQVKRETLVEQFKETPYLQFFLHLEGFQFQAPFEPSTMVYCRHRLPAEIINTSNERIVHYGKNWIEQKGPIHDDDDTEDGEASKPFANTEITDRCSATMTLAGALHRYLSYRLRFVASRDEIGCRGVEPPLTSGRRRQRQPATIANVVGKPWRQPVGAMGGSAPQGSGGSLMSCRSSRDTTASHCCGC